VYLLQLFQPKSHPFTKVGSLPLPSRSAWNPISIVLGERLINGGQALIGVFYGIAVSAASIRLILQIKIHRRLYLDDYFLLFACACLTAGTVLGYASVGSLYFSQDLNYNPTHFFYLLAKHVDIAAHINKYQRLYYSYPALLWTAIFVVKFGYLAFFRRLIDRIRPLIIYWRIIVGITIVSFPICIISIYVACTKWGLEAGEHAYACDLPG